MTAVAEPGAGLQLKVVSRSEVGLVRKRNDDSGLAGPRLVVVADGMGGAAAGDLASAVAVDSLRRVAEPPLATPMLETFAAAIREANDRIADLVEADFALEGMGTTVTGVMFDGRDLALAHIGDSRAYLLHDGDLRRLTHDHTWVQSLVDEGKISEAEAAVHPHRSLLIKVLNGQPVNEPDLSMVPVVPGDRVLVCSDGLCGLVDDAAIADAMRTPDLDGALSRLVDLALAHGGFDNITVLLADVVLGGGSTDVDVLGAAAERDVPSLPATAPGALAVEPGDGVGDASVAPPVEPPAEDEARYNPQPPRQRRRVRTLAGVLAVVVVLAGTLGIAYAWTRTQFYVGAHSDRVTIFQGVAGDLPGIPLSTVYEEQPLAVADLPPYYQDRVRRTLQVASLDAARVTVAELVAAARRCPQPAPGAGSSAPSQSSPAQSSPAQSSPAQSSGSPSVEQTPPATASGRPVAPVSPPAGVTSPPGPSPAVSAPPDRGC